MDDDEWVERLHRVVVGGESSVHARSDRSTLEVVGSTAAQEVAPESSPIDVVTLATTLQDIEQRLGGVEQQLASLDGRMRLLVADRDRLVGEIGDALVARLDPHVGSDGRRGWRSTVSRWFSG